MAGERFRSTQQDGVTLVEVLGDIDLRSSTELLAALEEPAGPVVVDLRACGFMDSTGVVTLLRGRKAAQERGARFAVVCRAEGPVHRLLQLVGASQMFPLYEDRDEAFRAAGAQDARSGVDRRG